MLSQKVMLIISLSVLVVCLVLSIFNVIFVAPVIFSLWTIHEQRDRIFDKESEKEIEIEATLHGLQKSISAINAELTLIKAENRALSTKLAFSTQR